MDPSLQICYLIITILLLTVQETKAETTGVDELYKTTAELVRLRGFTAENHYVKTPDGYVLNVVRVVNPEIQKNKNGSMSKEPVLCVHGLSSRANTFILNSVGSKPRDLSHLDAGSLSHEQLEELIGDDPTTNSMVLTMSNFGHEVWLLNRRGTTESLGTTRKDMDPFNGLPVLTMQTERSEPSPISLENAVANAMFGTFSFKDGIPFSTKINLDVNPRYWNYSADEQAEIDMPETINYILTVTNHTKLSIIAHSLGGTIFLQSLIKHGPKLENKIHKALLWGPSFYMGDTMRLNPVAGSAFAASQQFLASYLGPAPPPATAYLLKSISALLCQINVKHDGLCNKVSDIMNGPSNGQVILTPRYFNAMVDSQSAHQVAQVAQTVTGGKTRYFDYMVPELNQARYGQPTAPHYNVSKITLKNISFWAGNKDYLVPAVNTMQLADDLNVPTEKHLIDGEGIYFNHIAFFYHQNVSKLITIPNLKTLESK